MKVIWGVIYLVHYFLSLAMKIHIKKTNFLVAFLVIQISLLPNLVLADQNNIIRIGTFENKPIVFKGTSESPQGLSIDILNQIAVKEGWQIEHVHGNWKEVLEKLESNQIDLLVGIAYTEQRAELFHYTNQTLLNNLAISPSI